MTRIPAGQEDRCVMLDAAHLRIELDADLILRSTRYRVRRPTDFDDCR
jgi:hypothetical protein